MALIWSGHLGPLDVESRHVADASGSELSGGRCWLGPLVNVGGVWLAHARCRWSAGAGRGVGVEEESGALSFDARVLAIVGEFVARQVDVEVDEEVAPLVRQLDLLEGEVSRVGARLDELEPVALELRDLRARQMGLRDLVAVVAAELQVVLRRRAAAAVD